MTKTRQRERKRKRHAQAIAERAQLMTELRLPAKFINEFEATCDRIERERLRRNFGEKASYDDWEIEQVVDELQAEGTSYNPQAKDVTLEETGANAEALAPADARELEAAE